MTGINDSEYIINVGPGGTFKASGNYKTIPEDIDRMFEAWEKAGARKIAIYFHGGLVNETAGMEDARHVAPYLRQGGCTPACFAWETGLVETVSANITALGQLALFQKLLKLLLKKVLKRLGAVPLDGRGANDEPSDALIDRELGSPDPFSSYDSTSHIAAARGGADFEQTKTLYDYGQLEQALSDEITRDISEDSQFTEDLKSSTITVYHDDGQSRSIVSIATIVVPVVKVAYQVLRRFIDGTDHGIYPTIVEEILRKFYIAELGAWIWKDMKDKSDIMWKSNDGRSGTTQFAGRYFLDGLGRYLAKFPDTEVNLVGHSAGAIAICNLVSRTMARKEVFSFNHIILLAPACTTELFQTTLLANPSRYRSLRIFTMTDENECRDMLVPYLYTRSLLYLISGILEDEGRAFDASLLGLQRHIAFRHPYDTDTLKPLHDYLYETGSDRLCFSQTVEGAPVGLQTRSLKHGDFDDDPDTLASITTILKTK